MFRVRNVAAVMLFVMLTGSIFGDVYLKQKVTQSDAKKETEEFQETWVTPTKVRQNAGDRSSIFDLEKNIMITIDHAKKKYMEIPLDFSGAGSDENQEGMKSLPGFMQNMMKMEVTVQPLGEQKQIGQWSCEKYLQTLKMTMMTSETEIWASEDIHVNMEVYKKFSAALMASQPGFYKMMQDMMKESEKIKGIPVLQKSVSKAMGKTMSSTVELIEVKDVNAPADLFTVPAGYKKEKFKAE